MTLFEDGEPIYQQTLVVCGTEGCSKCEVPYVVDLPTNYPTSVVCGACGNPIPTVTAWTPPADPDAGDTGPVESKPDLEPLPPAIF